MLRFRLKCQFANFFQRHNRVKVKLLFSSYKHRFRDFDSLVGYSKPTLVIAKSNHKRVFGGFTDLDWKSSCYKSKGNSFVFRISRNMVEKFKHKHNAEIYTRAIDDQYMICFPGAFWFRSDCLEK